MFIRVKTNNNEFHFININYIVRISPYEKGSELILINTQNEDIESCYKFQDEMTNSYKERLRFFVQESPAIFVDSLLKKMI